MASSALSSTVNAGGGYRLSDDLARLCLPQEFKDSYRNLAWANSVCVLFLAVGLVGLKAPRVNVRPISEPVEPQTVVLLPPQEPPKIEKLDDTPQPTPEEVTVDTPVTPVVTVLAADTADVQFPVQVKALGEVRIAANAAVATAPPKDEVVPAAPKQEQPTAFNPNAEGPGGYFPKPDYPRMALKFKYQGTVVIELKVDASGAITDVSLQKSSGYALLDEAALDAIKSRWRFPPGKNRWYYYKFPFVMN